MLKELQKKKLLQSLDSKDERLKKFEGVFDDAETLHLSENINPPSKYYPQIEEHVPYGAGADKAKKSMLEALSRTYKDENEFAEEVNTSKQKKSRPRSGLQNYEDAEEEEQKKKDRLLKLYNKKAIS